MNNDPGYLSLRQLFVAYARMLASRDAFQAIRDYHEKRCRILSGLFEVRLQEPEGLDALAKCYTNADFYNPCGGAVLGSNGVERLPSFKTGICELRRHAADMRRFYARLGVEWLTTNYPGIENKRVSVARLREFGIAPKPPSAVEECIKAMESEEPEPANDDVPASVSDALKRGEEARDRARRETKAAIPVVIERALAAGIATPETVAQAIYEMDAQDFLNLAEGFPKLSRVDFKPETSK